MIAAAFASIGSVKPEAKYQLYPEQEAAGSPQLLSLMGSSQVM